MKRNQSPSIQQNLTPENLNNLPMFNPLNELAYVPRNTVFNTVPFAQAQGQIKRINRGNSKSSKSSMKL